MTPAFALATFIGILFCGITLDLGVMEYTRLVMQRAADAAVVGAQVSHDEEDSNWINNGVLDAAQNGFTNGLNDTTVRVAEQPNSGSYVGNYDAAQATITRRVKMFFMGALTGGTQSITVQSVALMTPCVYVTNAHGWMTVPYPLALTNGSSIGNWGGSTMGCPVYVGKGVFADAYSSLWSNATNVTGASSSSLLAGGIFHMPRFGAPVLSDPLAYSSACATLTANCIHGTASGVQPPSFSGCTYTNKAWLSGSIALSPGTYCNSFSFVNSTVTLSPGLYIIANGGTWTNSTVTGSGVTLYFTQGGDGKYGTFTTSATTMHLSAPTISSGGTLATILLMNDPAWVPTTARDFTFLNGSTNDGDGIYYTVNTGISIQFSTLSAAHYLGLDVDNLSITSSALAPKSNFTPVPSGNPFTPIGSLVQ